MSERMETQDYIDRENAIYDTLNAGGAGTGDEKTTKKVEGQTKDTTEKLADREKAQNEAVSESSKK